MTPEALTAPPSAVTNLGEEPNTFQIILGFLIGFWWVWFLLLMLVLIFVVVKIIKKNQTVNINNSGPSQKNYCLKLLLLGLFLPFELVIGTIIAVYACDNELMYCSSTIPIYYLVVLLIINVFFLYRIFKK